MTVAIAPQQYEHVLLHNISWSTYESLLHDLESEPAKRLTYDGGVLEIMVPLPPHEEYKKKIGRMIEVALMELGIEGRCLGQTTWKRQDLRKGLEADECYYIQNADAAWGKSSFDLTVDPPPDLVVEVDNTSSSLKRMSIYAALGVSEVWRFDGTNLTIYHLIDAEYRSQQASLALPMLQCEDVLRFLKSSQTMRDTAWIRSFQQWVRESLSE